MKPIYIHSGMAGAPQYANADGNINGILEACLVNGFNSRTAASASAIGGVLTLNFDTNPGFEALQTVEVALADVALVNGQHRVVTNASNQVTIAIAGLPDGAVGSTGAGITIKQAGAGWSKPFSESTKAVFRPPAGNRRYLRVVHVAGATLPARAYEDMTDVDTGTGEFPSVTQLGGAFFMGAISTAGLPWFAIATSKWFYFSIGNAVVTPTAFTTFFFGDVAAATVQGDVYSTAMRNHAQTGMYMCRNYAGQTGGIVTVSRDDDGSTAAWPSVVANGQTFVPYIPVVENAGTVLRGVLPNAYKTYPQISGNRFLDIYDNVSQNDSRMKPVKWASNTMTFCVAVDEEVWD